MDGYASTRKSAYVARITREWIEAVQRDYNHPSIIMWVPLNESWGVPNAADARQRSHRRAMYELTKSLDPTHLVIDNDGLEHTGCTDLMAIHDYSPSGEGSTHVTTIFRATRSRCRTISLRAASITDRLCTSLSSAASPIYPSASAFRRNSWGHDGIEPDEHTALQRIRGLYQAIARLPRFAGICYTQLRDVEQ